MRKSMHILLITLLLAVSSIAFANEATPAAGSSAQQQSTGVVNINAASAAQLALLPGVGATGAQRIVEYRGQHGPFKKTSDLMQVKGIGAKKFERLAPYIALSGETTLSSKVASPRKPRPTKSTD